MANPSDLKQSQPNAQPPSFVGAGVMFQKDLGLSTARIAGAMTTFNPDQSWSRVVIQQPQSQR